MLAVVVLAGILPSARTSHPCPRSISIVSVLAWFSNRGGGGDGGCRRTAGTRAAGGPWAAPSFGHRHGSYYHLPMKSNVLHRLIIAFRLTTHCMPVQPPAHDSHRRQH